MTDCLDSCWPDQQWNCWCVGGPRVQCIVAICCSLGSCYSCDCDCMCVCVCVSMCVCTCMCMCMCMCMCVLCVCAHAHACMCVYVCVSVHLCVCVCMCMRVCAHYRCIITLYSSITMARYWNTNTTGITKSSDSPREWIMQSFNTVR